MKEILSIFDESHRRLGEADRNEVHRKGYWHETFHCWLVHKEGSDLHLYFQLRSPLKKDYPLMLDITAAGHILSHETAADGVREAEEEIGLSVCYSDLRPLGIIKERLTHGNVLDNEICHTFYYEIDPSFNGFVLQQSEVSGMFRIRLDVFEDLISGKIGKAMISGFQEDKDGRRYNVDRNVHKHDFVPHEKHYFAEIISKLKINMNCPQ
ncbi:NUDIX hydrolase [Jeotgalibacillus sp. S-D1]|uniref:NUDIX hydrolase n=1 Tax=Jeotgalibacillus sp. S-D1 TaxID=2552189 RepID=UPI001059C3EB|nr:NUDIX hydrolase [Jeotgalibacillus sp. S-D1]TDL31363.1 NUDIX hydrolase [Jeotgalibacillus sp. S-D1]